MIILATVTQVGVFVSDQPEVLRLLRRLSAGERSVLPDVLKNLGTSVLLTPVLTPQVVAFQTGVNYIDVLTISYGTRRLVPTFTERELFQDWAAGRYDSLNLVGADLAASLPPGSSLLINPGTAEWVELSPAEVHELSVRGGEEKFKPPHGLECGNVVRYDAPPTGKLERDLSQILSSYEEVREGYYLPAANYPTSGIIGLVTRGLHEDRRFPLLTEIQEISKRYFGAGNALEVFDEDEARHSSVWDLFHAVPPFYTAQLFQDEVVEEEDAAANGDQPKSSWAPLKSIVNRLWGNSGTT